MKMLKSILLGAIAAAAFAGAAYADPVALEVVISKPKAGATLAQVLEADKAMGAYITKQPGFISREVGTSADNEVFVVVHWATMKDAEAAGQAFMSVPEGKAMLGLVDASVFKHFTTQ